MATITYFTDKQVAQVKPVRDTMFFAQTIINFAVKNAEVADVVQAIKIPKGAFVLQAGFIVKKVGTASGTATFGDTTASNGWDATACALDAAVDTVYTSLVADTYGALGGKLYVADNTLNLTIAGATMIVGEYSVWALYGVIEDVANN